MPTAERAMAAAWGVRCLGGGGFPRTLSAFIRMMIRLYDVTGAAGVDLPKALRRPDATPAECRAAAGPTLHSRGGDACVLALTNVLTIMWSWRVVLLRVA